MFVYDYVKWQVTIENLYVLFVGDGDNSGPRDIKQQHVGMKSRKS
jgi:hypothetical protein